MAAQSPLRRWKRFFPTFDAIDAAVEASVPAGHPGDELECVKVLQCARAEIVELLCDASEDDTAEELCRVLDDVMAESLITLQSVPVTPTALASTDLAMAVGALGEHESERVRGLARDIVRRWRASVERELARARSVMEELAKLSDEQLPSDKEEKKRPVKETPRPKMASDRVEPAMTAAPPAIGSVTLSKERIPVVGAGRANTAKMEEMEPKKTASDALPKKTTTPVSVSHVVRTEYTKASTKISESLRKKTPPVVGRAAGDGLVMRCSPEEKMEATKRKLREGYQGVEDAKRQRRIQVIKAPKILEQRQRNMHPIIRERSRARCGSTTVVRRSLFPSLQRI